MPTTAIAKRTSTERPLRWCCFLFSRRQVFCGKKASSRAYACVRYGGSHKSRKNHEYVRLHRSRPLCTCPITTAHIASCYNLQQLRILHPATTYNNRAYCILLQPTTTAHIASCYNLLQPCILHPATTYYNRAYCILWILPYKNYLSSIKTIACNSSFFYSWFYKTCRFIKI